MSCTTSFLIILLFIGCCTCWNTVRLLESDNELQEVRKNNKLSNESILVMFFAPSQWCKFSRKMHFTLRFIAATFPYLPVFKIDAYHHNKNNLKYAVFGFPSLYLIKEGEAYHRYQGDQSYMDIIEWIKLVLSNSSQAFDTNPINPHPDTQSCPAIFPDKQSCPATTPTNLSCPSILIPGQTLHNLSDQNVYEKLFGQSVFYDNMYGHTVFHDNLSGHIMVHNKLTGQTVFYDKLFGQTVYHDNMSGKTVFQDDYSGHTVLYNLSFTDLVHVMSILHHHMSHSYDKEPTENPPVDYYLWFSGIYLTFTIVLCIVKIYRKLVSFFKICCFTDCVYGFFKKVSY